MDKVRILIVDDDQNWCKVLKIQLEEYSDRYIVLPPAYNGKTAIQMIEDIRPEVILLDLILADYDGLYIITHIRNCLIDYNPFIYVLSAIGTQKTNQILQYYDVNYYSIKPIKGKAVASIIDQLVLKPDSLKEAFTTGGYSSGTAGTPPHYDIDLLIRDYLYDIGAPLSLIATRCTGIAIKICIDNQFQLPSVMALYKMVAEEFGSMSPSSVERNIRSTLKRVQSLSNLYFQKCFPDGKNAMTGGAFIFTSAQIVLHRIEEERRDTLSGRENSRIRNSERRGGGF